MSISHKQVLQQLFPLPLGEAGSVYDHHLTVAGGELDRLDADATTLMAQILPESCDTDMLARWWAVLQLDCALDAADLRTQVLNFLRMSGGLTPQHFTDLAYSLGITITIDDMAPFSCGVTSLGYPLWIPEILWCWRVNVLSHTLTMDDFIGKQPVATTPGGTGYLWRWDAIGGVLERLFNRFRSPGGLPFFFYPLPDVFDIIDDRAGDEDLINDLAGDTEIITEHAV